MSLTSLFGMIAPKQESPCIFRYIDNQTKATQVSQYELVLQKDSNWKIVG